ncbi:MAG: hypothetical protein HYX36_05015 [Rhizobiales bacterium]|nr:hypothetical protein [Hyphomicrobiales bacterium]
MTLLAVAWDIEREVSEAVSQHLGVQAVQDHVEMRSIARGRIDRVTVHSDRLEVSFRTSADDPMDTEMEAEKGAIATLMIPWSKPCSTRQRQILGSPDPTDHARPIRSEARTRLILGIARGRRWLEQLSNGRAWMVEKDGIEPSASCMPFKRSPD